MTRLLMRRDVTSHLKNGSTRLIIRRIGNGVWEKAAVMVANIQSQLEAPALLVAGRLPSGKDGGA
jgi:hypothetical protein